jgi:hydrogenase expression/formation protein HypC
MCLSIPKQVVAWEGAGDFAWVERDGRREQINMMLLGAQPLGTWVLTSHGLAREVLADEQRHLIEDALSAVAAALDNSYDAQQHFRDLSSGRHD